MDTSKATESVKEGGETEVKVETVDYRKPPGAEDQPPKKENVEVTHIIPDEKKPAAGGNVIAETAAKVGDKIQSAKEKLSGAAADTTAKHD